VADILWVLSHVQWYDIVDILLVTAMLYLVFSLAMGTQAVQLLRGMVLVIVVVFLVSRALPFKGFGWLVANALPALLIAIPVVFQPELRRALERLGRTGGLLARRHREEIVEKVVGEVARAAHRLSADRHGALIVFERETGLQDIVETGVLVDADVKAELLQTIFHPNTALHDKAVLIREDRIVAASCMLPVTLSPEYHKLGTRHRAAVGVTEVSDAMVVVVSEETGAISVAYGGQLASRLELGKLRNALFSFYQRQLAGKRWPEQI